MPLVVIQRDSKIVTDDHVKMLTQFIPTIISSALTTENSDGKLVANDIEVWVQNMEQFDVNTKSLEIIIWAGDCPERRNNLDERREKIVQGIRVLIPTTITGFVWVLLNPSSFGEF